MSVIVTGAGGDGFDITEPRYVKRLVKEDIAVVNACIADYAKLPSVFENTCPGWKDENRKKFEDGIIRICEEVRCLKNDHETLAVRVIRYLDIMIEAAENPPTLF